MATTANRLREMLDYDQETGVFRWKRATGTRTDRINARREAEDRYYGEFAG